jgi:2-oxoglutarate ferredoxin oxidoreductase subunit alpha
MLDDITINISTVNGTGSQTANKVLVQSLILSGYHVSAKNLFPSNIAGLPTRFLIRVSKDKYNSLNQEKKSSLNILFNKNKLKDDLQNISKDSVVLSNEDYKYFDKGSELKPSLLKCRALTKDLHGSVSVRKLLINMLYIGASAKVLGLKLQSVTQATEQILSSFKQEVLTANIEALKRGYNSIENTKTLDIFKPKSPKNNLHLYDGNQSLALGLLDGGAQIFTWYPITPSSSVAENFDAYSKTLNLKRAVLQCEDEISAVTTSLGAGWAGARAVTATSGPGLSLMQESIGLSYFTENPLVVVNVQRAGPSTGLPTRTAQGDLTLSYYSSHGDGIHPVLLPSDPTEAYIDGCYSLSLAQDLQTPVFVLSDLDIGMNEWALPPLKQISKSSSEGQIQIQHCENYKRFSNDTLVSKRSLPRLSDESTAYFTRGSGHDEFGNYSEDSRVYENKLKRLKDKINALRTLSEFCPTDVVDEKESSISLIYYGSTFQIIEELKDLIKNDFGVDLISTYRIRALPLNKDLSSFLSKHKYNFVLEQNRDGQMNRIIRSECASKTQTTSVVQYNGLPADAHHFYKDIYKNLNNSDKSTFQNEAQK